MKNFILLALSVASAMLSVVAGAPAVSSVHVSFVSGNKATQYSHGSGGDGKLVQYNLLEDIGREQQQQHTVKKRSVMTRGRPPRDPGGSSFETMRMRSRTPTIPTPTMITTTFEPITSTSTILTPTTTNMVYTTDTQQTTEIFDALPTAPAATAAAAASTKLILAKKSGKKRVRFIPGGTRKLPDEVDASVAATGSGSAETDKSDKSMMSRKSMTGNEGLDTLELQGTDVDTAKAKDTKAVKRSPFPLANNFVGSFGFPDFDEFGGNEFGSLGNFGSTGAGTQRQSYSNNRNPEALAPEGVFLSPLPTEAAHSHSHYVENDPYLADPDTAKYAAQHPPFFSEFPHKRTVLALNERREDNGLEPNILRSIRPFFPFFEANNRGHAIHGHAAPALYPVRQHHYTAPYTPSYFFDDLEPTIIYYAEQQHILPRVDDDPWSIFTVKK